MADRRLAVHIHPQALQDIGGLPIGEMLFTYDPPLEPMHHFRCLEIHQDGQFLTLKKLFLPEGSQYQAVSDTTDIEVQIPYQYVLCIVSGMRKRTLGFSKDDIGGHTKLPDSR